MSGKETLWWWIWILVSGRLDSWKSAARRPISRNEFSWKHCNSSTLLSTHIGLRFLIAPNSLQGMVSVKMFWCGCRWFLITNSHKYLSFDRFLLWGWLCFCFWINRGVVGKWDILTYPYPEPVYTGWSSVHLNVTGMPLVDPVYTGIPLGDPTNTCRVHWNTTGKT